MTTTTTYRVDGMTCDHCVHAITSEIRAIDGVRGVDIALATGQVTVTSDSPVAAEAIRAAVDEAGYTLA
jgi:copper ion binding protein